MKKYIKLISSLLLAMMLLVPVNVKADVEVNDGEQPLKVDEFIINSCENEKYNATLKTSAATETYYDYKITVVSDISQEGKEVARGSGKTGEDVEVIIDMTNINTYDNYRFKITVTYYYEGNEYFTHAFSKIFEYTQESFAEDLSGRDIEVEDTAKMLTVKWDRYTRGNVESIFVVIETDGLKDVEELVPRNKDQYVYYYDKDTKQITITLKQVINGKLSKGITDTIDIVKSEGTKDFYLEFPDDNGQYDSVWNIKYHNGEKTKVSWEFDNDRKSLEVEGDSTFLIDIPEKNQCLTVTYKDNNEVSWKYQFDTDIVTYAPVIKLLEDYDGSRVKTSSITLAGKVDDMNAKVKVNGDEVEIDKNGKFIGNVQLNTGKNVITLEATNNIGKSSKTTITVFKSGDGKAADEGGILGEYSTLIFTACVSVVLLVVLIVVSRIKRGKTDEKEN